MKSIDIKSTITAVTVYNDRARITRHGDSDLKKGVYDLRLPGLPAALDEYSLRVSGRGAAAVKIGGVRLEREYKGTPPDEERRKIRDAIQKLHDEKRALQDKQHFVQDKLEYYHKLLAAGDRDLARSLAKKRADIAEGSAILDFYFGNIERSTKTLQKLDLDLRKLEEKVQELQWQWDKLEAPDTPETKTAVVAVEVGKAGGFALDLSYVIGGAFWEPVYDLRFDLANKKLGLIYRAAVTQQTGEDWEGVEMSLSTARPQTGANPPELHPWYIDFYRPIAQAAQPKKAKMRMAKEAEEIMDSFATEVALGAAAPEDEPFIAEEITAEVVGEGPSVTYLVPGRPDVPADGDRRIVTVADEEFNSKIAYVLVPAFEKASYIRARSVNESELIMLPGLTNIFRDEEFVGRGEFELVNPGVEFDCYLGTDDRVYAEYESRRLDADSQGIIAKKDRITMATRCEVTSDMPEAEDIVVKDRKPVPSNKDIKIKIDKCSPEPAEDKENGLIEWRETISPGEKLEFVLNYTIQHPEDREITGV